MPIKLIRLIDRYIIGGLLLALFWLKYLHLGPRKPVLEFPRRILVIRLWALGSSLLGFSTITELKRRYPHTQLDLLATTRNLPVYRNQGYFDNMYNLFSLLSLSKLFARFKHYEIVLDCEEYLCISSLMALWLGKASVGYSNIWNRKITYTHSIKYNDQRHALLATMDLLVPLGILYTPPAAMESLRYSLQDQETADTFLRPWKGKTIICMHTGGAETSQERFWSPTNWAELIERLLDAHGDRVHIFLSGTESDGASVRRLLQLLRSDAEKCVTGLCGVFSLHQFAAFLKRANVMVSNDTGPMHLAAAMGTPTMGLFGPNLPQRFGPYPPSKNKALYKGDGKAYINVHLGEFAPCPPDLVNRITPQEVFAAVAELLQNSGF